MSKSLPVDNPKDLLFNLEEWCNIRYQTLINSINSRRKNSHCGWIHRGHSDWGWV